MLFSQLEYLVALAREGHFSRAAEACHVSQPALSAGIRKLEAEFDTQIVRRANRYEGLTAEGEKLVAWARKILADRQSLTEELQTMRGELTGTLRIGAIPTALPALCMLTRPFQIEHPRVRLSLLSLSTTDIRRSLTEFDIDAAVGYMDAPVGSGVRALPLYHERYVLLTSHDSIPADQESVTWAEAAAMRLCLLTDDMRNRQFLNETFESVNTRPRVELETNSISALYTHVHDGSFATVMPHTWLGAFQVPKDMRVIPLVEPRVTQGVGLLVPNHEPESMLCRALVKVADRVNMAGRLDTALRERLRGLSPTG
ncbi:DNA-binding transcriptional LysR family regulator [Lipingzhangella halophila]|uniref:DNA-binding transcriptional LysR family regulator n=1 Tax=Lipingzhangella halophila TaxID=1783352 RepID=A0A7W7RBZ3_9ACTN|nr:LysR family transcriptional regulator [Lipingzhangella halophila]MBB4929215.1 DNA-binding transcriptional LysR family regulator [Lipingzhangella halophila]